MNRDRILLVCADVISFILAAWISLHIRLSSAAVRAFGAIRYVRVEYLSAFAIALVLLVYIFSCYRLYRLWALELSPRIFTVLKALITWALVIVFMEYIIKVDFSRGVFLLTIGLTAVFVCIARILLHRRRIKRSDAQQGEVYIVGEGKRADDLKARLISAFPHLDLKIFSLADEKAARKTLHFLSTRESSDIFIAGEALPREAILAVLADRSLAHHRFKLVADTFKRATGEIRLDDIDEMPIVSIHVKPAALYSCAKRCFDIACSSAAMIAVLPIIAAIAVCIKVDSSGPVFVRQRRVGKNGKTFLLWKFRTMRADAPLYQAAPTDRRDGRVTRFGALLRQSSLDELPQLWNVLAGSMSLVGPRPEMSFLVEQYTEWQRMRLRAKPGITGLWQILGRKDIPLQQNLEYDFYYVANRSFFLDMVIVLKTLPAIVFGRGAY